jgi:FxsC-like protein
MATWPEFEVGDAVRYFFLSYAHGDDDEYVQRFYQDLCREIRVRKGLRQNKPVGFMDIHSVRLGKRWPSELVTALSECPVFLPLYSPGFFRSEFCGKEWAAFKYRCDYYFERTGTLLENIVPIMWFQPTMVPEIAQSINYTNVALGGVYAEWGLRQLIRLKRYEDDYQEAVTALAAQVVAISERNHLVSERPSLSFEDLSSPFHHTMAADGGAAQSIGQRSMFPIRKVSSQGTTTASTGGPPQPGSHHVYFVIASAGSEEVRSVRSVLDCYGPTARHWMPYQPVMPRPLGNFACEIAGRQHFGSELADLDDLPDRIEAAHRENRIVVLLVDPWAARISGYSAKLADYDRRNEPTVPVLIALNEEDTETRRCREMLEDTVDHVFPQNMVRQDSIFRPAVGSAEQFAQDLQFVLQEAVNRLLRHGVVRRRPPLKVTSVRPVLEGPSAS